MLNPDLGGRSQLSESMRANQARFPIAKVAHSPGAPLGGYYAWRDRELPPRRQYDTVIKACIGNTHQRSRGTYSTPHSRPTRRRRHPDRPQPRRQADTLDGLGRSIQTQQTLTTHRDHRLRPAPDIIEGRFEADAPDRLWVSDIPSCRKRYQRSHLPTINWSIASIVKKRAQRKIPPPIHGISKFPPGRAEEMMHTGNQEQQSCPPGSRISGLASPRFLRHDLPSSIP